MCWHFALYRTLIGVGRRSDGHGSTPFDVAIPTKVFPITDQRAKGHRNAFSRADGQRHAATRTRSLPPSPFHLTFFSSSRFSLFFTASTVTRIFSSSSYSFFLHSFLFFLEEKDFKQKVDQKVFDPLCAPPPQGVPITCNFIFAEQRCN